MKGNPLRRFLAWVALLGGGLSIAAAQEPAHPRGAAALGDEVDESGSYRGRHALLIGIDQYQDARYPDLRHAVADARGLAELLVHDLGFQQENVRLLENVDATKSGLEQALEEWACDATRISAEDLVVVFFAGHGVTRQVGEMTRGYLVPVDGRKDRRGEEAWSSLVPIQRLEDVSELIPARHVLFILDCCFGGIAVERAAPPLGPGLARPARQVLTAGTAEQTVQDGGGAGHSIFTATLLEALRGAAEVDGDGLVTFGELFNYVSLKVEAQTLRRQTPVQGVFAGHKGGSVALFPPDIQTTGKTAAERLAELQISREEQLAEIDRLADSILVRQLLEREKLLWPRWPEQLPELRSWLGEAQRLLANEPDHLASQNRVREEARLRQVLSGLLGSHATDPIWAKSDPKLHWRFELFSQVLKLFEELDRMVPQIEARLEFAATIDEVSLGDHADAWDEAITDISLGDAYGGLEIEPQLGLVPLRPDPDSGFWEFWHVGSGSQPAEHLDRDGWVINQETGLVLVLLPGGTFSLGARRPSALSPVGSANVDPLSDDEEGPVREVSLSPFFLSKYEMTQGQWLAFTQSNPSMAGPGFARGDKVHDLRHPVETLSWLQTDEVLRQLGLILPTEAQWEYAARAGTTSPWWTGHTVVSIQGAANLADRYARENGGDASFLYEDSLFDGYTNHAPVGNFSANAFGLHNTLGNVMEWCRDRYAADYRYPVAGGDGLRLIPEQFQTEDRVVRGGAFALSSRYARSSNREFSPKVQDNRVYGVRPARALLSADPHRNQ